MVAQSSALHTPAPHTTAAGAPRAAAALAPTFGPHVALPSPDPAAR